MGYPPGAYPAGAYPPGAYPSGGGYPVPVGYPPPPPRVGLPRPVAIEAIPGTPFGVAIVGIAPTASGPSAASLVAGIASILVALVVGCFGVLGANDGWGPIVSGAFAVLAAVIGGASVTLGVVGLRQIRRARPVQLTGRGPAIIGIVCGALGLILTATAMIAAFSLVGAAG
ncbi:MAG: hypothetical protein ACM30G_16800 [Micromonosporaceae bacterium]